MKMTKHTLRIKRHHRIRARVGGTAKRPRLSLFRSNTRLSGQVIDDTAGKTIASAFVIGKNKEHGRALGATLATLMTKKGITSAVFDRGGYKYHGVVQAVADALREGGVKV